MEFFHSGNAVVDTIGKWDFSGNVIPPIWFKTIVSEKGKTNYLAVVLLSDIVYWYRPSVVRNEETGEVLGWKKRFRGNMLQKSYEQMAEKTGENVRTVRRAVDLLVELGVIRRQKRTLKFKNGTIANNVLFIELIPEVLYQLTYPPKEKVAVTEIDQQYDEFGYEVLEVFDEVMGENPDAEEIAETAQDDVTAKRNNPKGKFKKAGSDDDTEQNQKVSGAGQNFVLGTTKNSSDQNRKLSWGEPKIVSCRAENGSTPDRKMSASEQNNVRTSAKNGQTNTKNTWETTYQTTTETPTQNSAQISALPVDVTDRFIYPVRENEKAETAGSDNSEVLQMKRDMEQVKANIRYEENMAFYRKNPVKYRDSMEWHQRMYDLICEIVCSRREYIRIGAEEMPRFLVRDRFLRLTDEHLRYVEDSLKTASRINNIRAYLLTSLFNSVSTLNINDVHEADIDLRMSIY